MSEAQNLFPIFYAVLPDSVRLELSYENKVVATFRHRDHAEKWAAEKYGRFYEIREVTMEDNNPLRGNQNVWI